MKKRLIGLLAAITLLSQVGFVMPLTAGAAGNAYYVSVTGSDQNPGTTVDAPFKTISKATKVMKAGDTCYIMGGTYREAVDMNIYGTATEPVTYQAYNNEKVIVTTADLLTEWEACEPKNNVKIWRAPMNWTVKSGRGNMVFDANVMKREASWPNISDFLVEENWAHIGNGELNMDYKTATITHANIPDVNLKGAIVSYDTDGGYWNYTSVISESNSSNTIKFTTADHTKNVIPATGKKFYITRSLELIDEPGEWYKNESEGYMYYATSLDVAEPPQNVAAKKRNNTLIMDNARYVVVKDITLQGGAPLTGDLTKNCTWDGITVVNADYEIYGDRTQKPAATGFVVNGSYNTLKNSEIKESYGHGVSVQGHDNRIINNEIHDINYQHNYSDAVSVNGTRNLVSYNTMYRLGRGAIGGSPVNCEISYNEMSDAMRISADGGFIYLLGDRGNTRIHHNVIHDVANDASDGFKVGIYYDASSTKLITYNNVIYNINGNDSSELFLNTPSVNNVFFNNTIMNDSPVIKVDDTDTGTSKSTLQGVVFINNLFKTDPLTNAIRKEQDPVYMNNVIVKNGDLNSEYKPVSGSSVIDAGTDISGITDNVTDGTPDVGAYEYGVDWVAGKQDTTPEVSFEEDTKIPFKNIAVNYGFENDFEGYTIETGTPTIMDFSSWSFNNLFTFTGDKALALDTNDSVSYKATGLKPNTEYEIEFFSKIRGMLLKPSEVDVKIEGNSFITATSSIGGIITGIKSGDYIGYKNVDFGNGRFDSATFHLMGPEKGTEIEVRLDDPKTGDVIATYTRTKDLEDFFDTYWMPYDTTVNGMSSIKEKKDVYVVFKTVKSQEFTYGGLELHNSNTNADKIEATAISDNGASYKHEAVYKEELNKYSSSIMEPTWGQKPEKFTATTGSLGELDIYLKKSAGENIGYIDLLAIRDASLDSVEDILVGNAKIVDGNFNEVLSLGNSTVNIVEFEAQNNLKDAIECSFTAIGYKADGTEASKSIIDVTMKPFEKRTIGVGVNLQNIPGGYIELTTQKEVGDPITSVLANIFAVNQREATEGIVIDKVWLSDTLQKVTAGEENKTFNAMIKNTTNADKTIACIVAFYGDNNRLLFAGREEKVLKASEINTFTKIINVPAGCTYAKMFAWDITEGANGATQIAADIALGL